MIGLLFALLAIVSQPHEVPAEFSMAVLFDCQPIVQPGMFVGCETQPDPSGESLYAGLTWIDGQGPALVTGP